MTYEEFEARYEYNPAADRIGGGGFGVVYKARDTYRNRWVAIKECKVEPHKFSLKREVELVAEIGHHVNIARYENNYRFKLGRVEMDYAIMQYYPEGSLANVINSYRLTPNEQLAIIEGLLHGLEHIHKEGFIHRDFKPGNVLMERISDKWVPKITDFGMTKLKKGGQDLTDNSANAMTIAYAAPEQVEGKPIKDNTDLWALGVIVFRLFKGYLPFDSDATTSKQTYNLEISKKILSGNIPSIATIDKPFRSIVEHCLVVNIEKRVQNAGDLLPFLYINNDEKEFNDLFWSNEIRGEDHWVSRWSFNGIFLKEDSEAFYIKNNQWIIIKNKNHIPTFNISNIKANKESITFDKISLDNVRKIKCKINRNTFREWGHLNWSNRGEEIHEDGKKTEVIYTLNHMESQFSDEHRRDEFLILHEKNFRLDKNKLIEYTQYEEQPTDKKNDLTWEYKVPYEFQQLRPTIGKNININDKNDPIFQLSKNKRYGYIYDFNENSAEIASICAVLDGTDILIVDFNDDIKLLRKRYKQIETQPRITTRVGAIGYLEEYFYGGIDANYILITFNDNYTIISSFVNGDGIIEVKESVILTTKNSEKLKNEIEKLEKLSFTYDEILTTHIIINTQSWKERDAIQELQSFLQISYPHLTIKNYDSSNLALLGGIVQEGIMTGSIRDILLLDVQWINISLSHKEIIRGGERLSVIQGWTIPTKKVGTVVTADYSIGFRFTNNYKFGIDFEKRIYFDKNEVQLYEYVAEENDNKILINDGDLYFEYEVIIDIDVWNKILIKVDSGKVIKTYNVLEDTIQTVYKQLNEGKTVLTIHKIYREVS